MKFKTREIGNVGVIAIEGGLFFERADDFQKELAEMYERRKIGVVVDLEKCDYINCVHLNILILFKKKFLERGGDLKVARPNSIVKDILEITNLHETVEVFDSVETAAVSFNTGRK